MAARGSELPRVRVAGLLLIDGKVVLARHRAGRNAYHLLPGGGVSWGESLEQALVREMAEETGLAVRPLRPIVLNDTIAPDRSRHVVNITFFCELVGGTLTEDPDDPRVEAVDLVSPGDLESLDLRPPIAPQLAACIEHPECNAVYAGALYKPG